jgi:acyl-coenzyme A thioesterase PaaI-like protein
MPADSGVLTIEFKINLLAPARGPRFQLVGQVTKAGRTISVVDGQAFEFDDSGARKLIATMSATTMTVVGRDGVRH